MGNRKANLILGQLVSGLYVPPGVGRPDPETGEPSEAGIFVEHEDGTSRFYGRSEVPGNLHANTPGGEKLMARLELGAGGRAQRRGRTRRAAPEGGEGYAEDGE